jgi:hypothetical protein
MTTTNLFATMLDGRGLRAECKTYMCTADRIAFERRFKLSSTTLSKLAPLYDEDGKPKPGADFSEVREEWTLFYGWRALARELNGQLGDFDAFCEEVDELDVHFPEKEAAEPNPTIATPPPTS